MEQRLPQPIEEKYEQARGLISLGRERGYLLYDELNDVLPAEVHSSEETDNAALHARIERYGNRTDNSHPTASES